MKISALITALVIAVACCSWQPIAGVAVISVDCGTSYLKIGIVSPGVPMEMVLNKESKRKTSFAISIRDDEREFGDNALALSTRFPEKVYSNILQLIGKTFDNPIVHDFQKKFPFYKIVADETRNTVLFKHDDETYFSPELLTAMILEKAREYAEATAGQPIHDAVLTVPAFFNQAERKAFKSAAELAGLKVLQLISNNAAVALNYGVFRRKDFNSTMQNIMFYDVGAGSAVATIVGYQVVKLKEKGYVEENPQLTVLGVGYDRQGGGLELTLRLRDYLAKKFNEKKLTSKNVFQNGRAMAKLLKEAERVKMVLSVNSEFVAQVEGLLDEIDFKLPITRIEFEELCEDLFQRIGKPIETALKSADLTMDNIDQIILVGAGTRVPRVQSEILKHSGKKELGKSLNTDESAALGAVYQAAHLSKGFKVKRFNVKEAVMFPIQVSFEREREPSEGTGIKHVTRTLFGPMNPYPQKKVITFNRHVKDFSLLVNYGNLTNMNDVEKSYFGSTNILNVSISNVAEQLSKHTTDESEYKGVKAHFKMDECGILSLDHVECVFEKSVPDVPEDKGEESAFSLIGNKISQLFSGMTGEEKPETEPSEEPSSETAAENETKSDSTENVNKTLNGTESSIKDESIVNKTDKNETVTSGKSKIVSIKEPISVEEVALDLKSLSTTEYKAFKDRLKLYNDKEKEKFELEEARNALESFVLETREKLYEEEFIAASTEEEKEEIRAKLSDISDWLDEDSDNAKLKVFKEKLSSIKSATRSLYERVKEHRERPDAFAAIKEMLNASEYFWKQASNISEEDQYFTNIELDTLIKLINETKKWANDKVVEQDAVPLFKTPIVTVQNIVEKMTALDREVKYLINKARTAKPKPKKSKNDTQEADKTTNTTKKEDKLKDVPEESKSEIPLETSKEEPLDDTQPTENVTLPPPSEQAETEKTVSKSDEAADTTPKPSKTSDEEHSEL